MDWDSRYRSGGAPAEPHRLAVEAARMFSPGRALDLACGAGRNARYLAERGWQVTAVDLSVAALQLARMPRMVVADLERDATPFRNEQFDLILIINFLHRPLFADALRVLHGGGAIAAAIRTTGSYSLPPGELRGHFAECRIVVEREGEIVAIKNSAASDRSASS
jgi:SAM-dependent methyltransferase